MSKTSKTSQPPTRNGSNNDKTVVRSMAATNQSKPHLTATPRKSRRISSTTIGTANPNLITPQKQQPRRSLFQSSEIIPENVRRVYKIVQKRTGTIGGNGSGGPIYGELVSVECVESKFIIFILKKLNIFFCDKDNAQYAKDC